MFSVFSVPRSGFSVFSGQKRLARWAGFTTEHTERAYARHRTHRKFSESMGFGLQCIQCAAKRLQCVQWPKTAGTVGGFYHRTHRTGYARHRIHRRFSGSMGFGLQCIQCAAKRLQCVQWPKTPGTVGGFYHRTHRTGLRPTQNTQKIFGKHGVRSSVYSVCREAASVCSVAKNGWHGGWVLPQNTQNGLRPSQNTQKIFGKHGVRTSVYSVCREAASVCSVAKNGWHGGRVLPQNTQNGLRPSQNTQNVLGKGGAAFSVFSVPPEAASVCSVVERKAA